MRRREEVRRVREEARREYRDRHRAALLARGENPDLHPPQDADALADFRAAVDERRERRQQMIRLMHRIESMDEAGVRGRGEDVRRRMAEMQARMAEMQQLDPFAPLPPPPPPPP
mmetsp:Transcript_10984/g.35833  ORF Transcript_10984/g.35833 Transcript_10984/m.35833 type:complete len:115 (-) Transcript_10984:314-658(-)